MIGSIPQNISARPRPVATESAANHVPDEIWERIALLAGPQATLEMSRVSTDMRRALSDVRGLVALIAQDHLKDLCRTAAAERAAHKRAYFVERRLDTLYLFEEVPLVGPVLGLLLVEGQSRAARKLKRSLGWQVAFLPVSIVALPLRVAPLIYGLQALSQRRQAYLTTKADDTLRLARDRRHLFAHGITDDPRWRLAASRKWVEAPTAPDSTPSVVLPAARLGAAP